jgi:hypothetical protein
MNEQHQAAHDQITNITQMGRALGRGLLLAIDGMEAIANADTDAERQAIHDRYRNDVHAIIGEVM